MEYRTFHCSRIGASHARVGLPCQDCSATDVHRDASIAAVADGHGSRRHFRSQDGARIACEVALGAVRRLLDDDNRLLILMDEQMDILKKYICARWRAAVEAHYARHPWTDAELDEARALLTPEQLARLADGSDAAIAYGTTLCVAWVDADGWAAVQIGDGCLVHVSPAGEYDWPMPESLVNQGNRTASLCMADPMRDFRHCWGSDRPAALLLCTDGIEKSFPPMSAGIVSLMHWTIKNEKGDAARRADNLSRTLERFTDRSAIGDDVSIAGIVDVDAPDAEPKPGRALLRGDLNRLRARIAEIENTVAFNAARLAQTDGAEDAETAAQLRAVIERKRAETLQLREEEGRLAISLGMRPMEAQPIASPDSSARASGEAPAALLWETDDDVWSEASRARPASAAKRKGEDDHA